MGMTPQTHLSRWRWRGGCSSLLHNNLHQKCLNMTGRNGLQRHGMYLCMQSLVPLASRSRSNVLMAVRVSCLRCG